jgi:hypothetical protein
MKDSTVRNAPHDLARRGPDSDAHAELACPFGDVSREHAVDARHGQQQRRGGERREERQCQPPLARRSRDDLIHRCELDDGLRWIDRRDRSPNVRCQACWIASRTHDEDFLIVGAEPLPLGHVPLVHAIRVEQAMVHVADDTDHRANPRFGSPVNNGARCGHGELSDVAADRRRVAVLSVSARSVRRLRNARAFESEYLRRGGSD